MFDPKKKRRKTEEDDDVIKLKCAFIRVNYPTDTDLPKSKIIAYCGKNKLKTPVYKIINEDKLFRAICCFQDKKYSSSYW